MLAVIVFILILGLLVFVHELGHFMMARKFGVRADEFGFGFPPRVFGWQRDKNGKLKFFWRHNAPLEEKVKDLETDDEVYVNNGDTIYSLNLIPLGGFVRIKGEMGENPDDEDSFAKKSAGKRSLILIAGVTMNVLLAIVLISIGLLIGVPHIIDDDMPASARIRDEKIQFSYIEENSPADEAGLKTGDIILSIDGQKISGILAIQNYIDSQKGGEIEVELKRLAIGSKFDVVEEKEGQALINNETGIITKKIKVSTIGDIFTDSEENLDRGAIGVSLVKTGLVSYPWYQVLWRGTELTINLIKELIVAFYYLFKNLIINQKASMDVAGPIGIAILTKEVTKLGLVYVLQFAAVLSINLAIINILPIPALDGGRLLFILIEKIRRKQVNQRLEAALHNIVFILLLILLVFITYKDVMRFIIN